MESRKYSIYGLYDPNAGELRYVGQTTLTLQRRLNAHIATANKKNNRHVCNWIRSLGDSRPVIGLIEEVQDGQALDEREAFWISHYKGNGAKLTNCLPGGKSYSEEKSKKISRAMTGKKWSPEACARASERMKGHVPSEAQKEKHSKSLTAFYEENERSIEARKNLSIAHGGRSFLDQNGNEYFSFTDAADKLSLKPGSVRSVLNDKMSNTKGYVFRYVDQVAAGATFEIRPRKPMSEDQKRFISESQKGRKQSPETIAKRTASRMATLKVAREAKLKETI